jgi:subtilase family serine protease
MNVKYRVLYPLTLALFAAFSASNGVADGISRLSGHVPLARINRSHELGRKSSSSPVQLAIVLNPTDPAGLSDLLQHLYTPGDPLFHQFLTPEQFASRFSPSDQDIDQVSRYLNDRGLNVTSIHSNHLVVDVEGSVSNIENAFQIELHEYLSDDGRVVYAPTSDPAVADEISPRFSAIVGLSNFSSRKSLAHSLAVQPHTVNPNNYMNPTRTKSVYGLNSLSQTGAGETLGLLELDGYTSSDIQQYESNFSLAAPTLTNVLIDGATGTPSSGADSGAGEVTLDIELAIGMAPGLTKILVYEAPNSDSGLVDAYSRIASDNLSNEVSTSWGIPENNLTSNEIQSEATIFVEMAAHGQSVFSAAGDDGAYDDSVEGNNSTLVADDPATQPYVTGVGGTTVTWSGNSWSSETSWTATAATGTYGTQNYSQATGGGGGISSYWSLPAWQTGLSTTANKGSSTMRMVPDVSLEADPQSGYPVYYNGAWAIYGGTSCAAPIWAAFTALVNQQRVANGQSRLGFMNPSIYSIGKSAYSSNFHDIADGSTNLYYPATTGYDLTTGWGTINGTTLFNSLAAIVLAPATPATLTLAPGVLSITLSWTTVTNAISYTVLRSTSANGSFSTIATGLSSTTYTDANLTYGTAYYYKVEAVNTEGTSSPTTAQSNSPYPPAPGAPSALEASVLE